ncbi:IclR family transcriptional regulator [Sulfurihydrogenibium yellowstonense]|jgi:Transcriptional regulator|uniref:Transcriptional regulator, IclR family n=1 Tax=Sulfurihydrogenibium yellowstonense SS-5 TaxID=432331 RepID=C4FJD9_9AQUI|nr:IclR family transcriptional regulator [Sulfurihydrogenibium yellowstonense]EEP60804.1 transcriptional regulator, IclR family [Sulfurihydrogenibium yellowstonense SS-5]
MQKKGAKKSIEKALDLLEALKEKDNLGVTELSNILGLNKNNVFRLLATLEVKGLIEQDPETGHYRLGVKTLLLEYSFIKNLTILNQAKQFVKQLRNKTNETVYLSLMHQNDIVYFYSKDSKSSVLVNSRIAKRYPAIETAPGRAILRAKKELGDIFEYDFEGLEPEVAEIATVIRDESDYPVAALSIVAPISRLNKSNYDGLFKHELLQTAKEITSLYKIDLP